MKLTPLMGFLAMAYGVSSPAQTEDLATLTTGGAVTISGAVLSAGCVTDGLQERVSPTCRKAVQLATGKRSVSLASVEVKQITLPDDPRRQMVIATYD